VVETYGAAPPIYTHPFAVSELRPVLSTVVCVPYSFAIQGSNPRCSKRKVWRSFPASSLSYYLLYVFFRAPPSFSVIPIRVCPPPCFLIVPPRAEKERRTEPPSTKENYSKSVTTTTMIFTGHCSRQNLEGRRWGRREDRPTRTTLTGNTTPPLEGRILLPLFRVLIHYVLREGVGSGARRYGRGHRRGGRTDGKEG